VWAHGPQGGVTYGDVYLQNEVEMSTFNFELADIKSLFEHLKTFPIGAL
jgi:glycyl-tRNA synthetase alpha chain